MPISTTDVVTNCVNGVETSNNGSLVVGCLRTGNYNQLDSVLDIGIDYAAFENKYTNRFDDVTYYTIGNETIVGG